MKFARLYFTPMDISLVIPLYNEAESLPELCAWIKRVLDAQGYSYEIILVDDGSNDNSWAVIQSLKNDIPEISSNSSPARMNKSQSKELDFMRSLAKLTNETGLECSQTCTVT